MIHVFNTMNVDREYTDDDNRGFITKQQFGMEEDFYGGRVYAIGKTDTDVYLLIENRDGPKAFDTCAKDLTNIPFKVIAELARKRKFKMSNKTTKEELIAMLEA